MTDLNKSQITEKLVDYVSRYESQNKAANSLKRVSVATISQILNHNWDLISDEMWRSIAAQIGWSEKEWISVETKDYKLFTALLTDAQENSNVFAVTGEAGTGKTFTIKNYTELHKRVYSLPCAEFWNRRVFMQELLNAMGVDYSGYNVNEMIYEVVRHLKKQVKPLIILDEADKLPDPVLYFFITLYNQLEGHCGIVLVATDHLAKRIRRGLKLNKKGYKEIYSRIGRKFIELAGPSASDIAAICMANGILDKATIKDVISDSENDLRRVRRKIHAIKNIGNGTEN